MIFNRVRRRIYKSFQAISLIWLCSMVAGCQTTIQSNIRPDYNFENNKDTGLVIGTVGHPEDVDAMAFTSFYINHYSGNPKGILSFRERSLFYSNHPAEFEYEDAGNKGMLFVLEFPAGEHSVDYWTIQFGFWIVSPKSAPTPLDFKLQPGEILYLGNFHMHPTKGKYLAGEFQNGGIPVITDQSDRDIQRFRELYPNSSTRNIKSNVLHDGPWTNELNEPDVILVPISD